MAQPAFSSWGSVSQYYYGGQSADDEYAHDHDAGDRRHDARHGEDLRRPTSRSSSTTSISPRAIATETGTAGSSSATSTSRISSRTAPTRTGSTRSTRETRYLPGQLLARVGRQSATSGGVLGLFDGAVGSWGFLPNYRVNAVVGQPVDNPFNTTIDVLRRERRRRQGRRPLQRQRLRDPAGRRRRDRPPRNRRRAPLLRQRAQRLFDARLRSAVSRRQHRHGPGHLAVPDADDDQRAPRLPAHADAAADQCAHRVSGRCRCRR